MATAEESNLNLVRRYLEALEGGMPVAAVGDFFTPDVVQEEFPNRLLPQGARRGIAELKAAAERGGKVMSAQRFTLLHAVASEDHVAVEVQWAGILAVPYGSLPIGGEMRARFAIFLDIRDGKIAAQRNYDCFDAW